MFNNAIIYKQTTNDSIKYCTKTKNKPKSYIIDENEYNKFKTNIVDIDKQFNDILKNLNIKK